MSRALLTDLATGKVYLLDGRASIGRSSDNDVVLNDATVSGHHAVITSEGSAWYIADNKSQNGVEMNRFRIPTEGKLGLREGCQLKLGDTLLRFTADAEAVESFVRTQRSAGSAARSASDAAGAKSGGTGAKTGRKKISKGLVLFILFTVAIAALLFGTSLSSHSRGNRFMTEGKYEDAYEAYGKDLFFSRAQLPEAALRAGEAVFERENYDEAVRYFLQAGEPGKERIPDVLLEHAKALSEEGEQEEAIDYFKRAEDAGHQHVADAVYEQAVSLIDGRRPEEALQLLEQIADETRAQEQIGAAMLKIARRQFEEGNIDEAVETAKSIQNTKYADVPAFLDDVATYLDKVNHDEGKKLFSKGNYSEAKAAFDKCTKDPTAKRNAEILATLLARDYLDAAMLAVQSIDEGSTDLNREQWRQALEKTIGRPVITGINEALAKETAKKLLSDEDPAAEGKAVSIPTRKSAMVGSYDSSTESRYYIPDLKSFYTQCGKDPQGKILIIVERHDYPEHNASYAVLFDFENALPAKYYPSSLDEVEYIVLVSFDYQKTGNYMNSTVALREFAEVRVIRLPYQNQMYRSQRINGDSAPYSFMYSGNPPAWKSGDAPDMGSEIEAALSVIMK